MKKYDQLKRIRSDSAATMKALQKEASKRRFLVGSHNAIRLKKSLAASERLDLDGRTLLTPKVHQAHAAKLAKRYDVLWKKIRIKALSGWSKIPKILRSEKPTDTEIAGHHLRFLTVVDSVTAVDAGAALKACAKLKEKLTTTAQSAKGIGCLGVIEVGLSAVWRYRHLSQARPWIPKHSGRFERSSHLEGKRRERSFD